MLIPMLILLKLLMGLLENANFARYVAIAKTTILLVSAKGAKSECVVNATSKLLTFA